MQRYRGSEIPHLTLLLLLLFPFFLSSSLSHKNSDPKSFPNQSMATIIETIQKRNFLPTRPIKEDLPTFNVGATTTTTTTTTTDNLIRLRRRISDKIQPLSSTSVSSVFARSRSHVPASFSPLLRWWSWGVGWILAARPPIVADLEMNEEEAAVLGTHSKGSLRHVLYRVQYGLRKLVAGSGTQLPVSHKVKKSDSDSFSYTYNGNRFAAK